LLCWQPDRKNGNAPALVTTQPVAVKIQAYRRARLIIRITVFRPGRSFVKAIAMDNGDATTLDTYRLPGLLRVVFFYFTYHAVETG
jgi:hypothetical protein